MDVLDYIEQRLECSSSEEKKTSSRRFFKEEVKALGVLAADCRGIARDVISILKDRSKNYIFEVAEELWRTGYIEKCNIACELLYSLGKKFVPEDFAFFERLVDCYVTNWANCDGLCNHTIGTFIEMYPQFLTSLKSWTKSENRWKKRAAAVSLIVPARKGLFLEDILAIADALVLDNDYMVQKGYGWLLKVASEAHGADVFNYLLAYRETMPRTAFRYAMEKMPGDWKKILMKK